MPLDVQSSLDTLINILKANTATLASSLTSAPTINLIKAGDSRSFPVSVDQYPAILVKLTSEEESFAQIGRRNNKHKLDFIISALVYEQTGPEESDKDCRTLAKNIKGVLKSNITLSNTAYSSLPERVEYYPIDLDGIYCSAALINFSAEYLST